MKKVIASTFALILCLALLMPTVSHASEILFRDIPWMLNYNDVSAILENDGIRLSAPGEELGKDILHEIEQRSSSYDKDRKCIYTTTNLSDYYIGTYAASYLKLYFVFTPNEDGVIDQLRANTAFYMAKCAIKPSDFDTTWEEFKQAFTTLYGEPRTVKNTDGCSDGASSYLQWDGDNGTSIVEIKDGSASDDVLLLYLFNQIGTELINKAEKLLKNPPTPKVITTPTIAPTNIPTIKPTTVPTAKQTEVANTVPPQIARASLKPGDNNDAILQIKQKMQQLGYFREGAELSSSYNSTMVERVMLFQQNNGLPQTGEIDSAFLAALYGAMPISNGSISISSNTTRSNNTNSNTSKSSSSSTSSAKNTSSSKSSQSSSSSKSSSGSYIGNKNSKVFHYPSCSDVGRMKDKNKVYFSSRDEAVSRGYKSCGHCHP